MTPVDSWATQSPLLLPTVSARAPARAGVSGPSGALPHGTSIQVVLRCDAVKHPFFGVGVFAICLRHASRLFGDVELATPTVGASLTCAGPPLDGSKPGLDEQAAPSAEKNRIGTKPYRKCMGLSFELEVVAAGARHRRLRVSRSIAIRAPCAAPPALRPFPPCDDAGPRRPQRSAQQSQRRRCCAGCCAAGLRSTGKTDYCCIPYTQSVSTCQQDSTIMCDAGFGLSCAGTDTPTRGGEGQGPMRSRLSHVTRAALHGQPWVLCEARILLVKQAEAEDRAARRLDPLAVDAVVA